MRFGDNTGNNNDETIQRTANLTGASSATLSFNYRRENLNNANDEIWVEISSDGTPFVLIATIEGAATDATYQNFSLDITPYISATTVVRITVEGALGTTEFVYVDNIDISYSVPVTGPRRGRQQSVSSLVDFPGGGGLNNVTDVDAGAVTGIAITAADSSRGTWYYSLNGGTTWLALGAVADATARLLAADGDNRLYFQPEPNFDGDASITFRAWDQTSGTDGGTFDTTTNGGNTAFSSTTDTATVDVTAVADAPVVNAPGIVYWSADIASPANVTAINRISFQDVDSASTVRVTLTMDDVADDLIATTGGDVTVGGSTTNVMTFYGTIAAINAFLFAGNVQWSPSGTPDGNGDSGTLTVAIDDNGTTAGGNVASTSITISELSADTMGSVANDFSGVNVNGSGLTFTGLGAFGSGNNGDNVTTSWSHQPAATTTIYDGDPANSGDTGDTITLLFTPDQLAEILADGTLRADLTTYLDGSPSADTLTLETSTWNANVQNFDIANISLATRIWSRHAPYQ